MRVELDGRRRAVIERLTPCVDGGACAAKRVLGETIRFETVAITDGHDQIACMLRFRRPGEQRWNEVAMDGVGHDTWRAELAAETLGRLRYTTTAWIDDFLSWRHNFARRRDSSDIAEALREGADLARAAAARADGPAETALLELAARLTGAEPLDARRALALTDATRDLMRRYPNRGLETAYERELEIVVERPLARFSAWYEFFPRSTAAGDEPHGTFATATQWLKYVAEMGFDVLYMPPIHPIGRTNRQGPNNTLVAAAGDPGSPWAIGGEQGGHKAVHPWLGTLDDFRRFREEAEKLGVAVALDIAFQCSPDHPYVREHPEWFKKRRDGGIQYAENPPKKYEDIYPFDFECAEWRALWEELRDVVLFWIDNGVTVFRVDNPHTKPFKFWEWLIAEVQARHPEALFLAEAFARPNVMYRLAKLGFGQSYTYFTWRNTKREILDYFADLAGRRDYFRPNLWPNTPDILHEYLQFGGRPAFMCRAVLAATLAASYGIYGPPFELVQGTPREPGSEEYLDSEKYQVRSWNLRQSNSLKDFLARLNTIRRENAALQADRNLWFHVVDNDQLVAYSKHTDDVDNIVVVIANLDPHHTQAGFVELPLEKWGLAPERPFQVHDLLSGARFLWTGRRNYVALDPQRAPAHVFRLRRHVGTERDFDYFM
jgi:starch synthase (maltosyl-transferring)